MSKILALKPRPKPRPNIPDDESDEQSDFNQTNTQYNADKQWRSQGGHICMFPRRSWKLAFVSGFWGLRPRPPPGLCPWTPLGDFPRPPSVLSP